MGISGLLGFLGNAAPYAANAEAAKNQAAAQGIAGQRQMMLQMFALQQQARAQAVQQALERSRANYYGARTNQIAGERKIMRGPGGQLVDVTNPTHPTPLGPPPIVKPTGPVMGSPAWLNAQEQLEKLRAKYRPAPEATIQVLPGADGNPPQGVITHGPGLGKTIPIPGVQAKGAGGAGGQSGIMLQTLGRMGMSMNDLASAIKQMDAYENNPNNLAKLTPFKQAIGAASEATPNQEAKGFTGVLNNSAGAFTAARAQKYLAQNDPAYKTYLFNKQRVATAFTELLPRPNQQLLHIEKGLSGIDVGWNPDLIGDVQTRRTNGYNMLKDILSSSPLGQKALQGHGGAQPSGGAKPKSSAYGIFGPGGDE